MLLVGCTGKSDQARRDPDGILEEQRQGIYGVAD